jgi:hypothetical protein
MPEPESSDQLLRKLCELQEQQLAKLTELSESVSAIAASSRATQEDSIRQTEAYAESQREYAERVRKIDRGRIPALILLGLIVVAIIVSRFL